MKIFKSMTDLEQLRSTDPALAVIKKHFVRMAEFYPDNGYLILIEEEDMKNALDLPELQSPWADVRWEGVSLLDERYLYAVFLCNNEYALEFLFPIADWIPAPIKENLEDHLI